MSKYQFQQSDIYQPGTDLPVNRLNIADQTLLRDLIAAGLSASEGEA